jgi:hypothetical protein
VNFTERLTKLALPFLNTRDQKGFLDQLDLEIDYWKAIKEKCKDEKQGENIKKNLNTLDNLRSVVARDPKGARWGYIDKKEQEMLERAKNRKK